MANIDVFTLTKSLCAAHAEMFLSFSADQEWERWNSDNLLLELPGKWEWSLMAVEGDRPLAYLIASRKEHSIHIHHFIVSPECRRRGVGFKLAGKLEQMVAAVIGKSFLVTLKVHRDNREAINFYRQLGYGTTQQELVGDYLSMEKQILGNTDISVAVHQPNYIPWIGYFAKMSSSNIFVFLDDVQMPQGRSFVSRTKIRRGNTDQWLTLPVCKKKGASINEIIVASSDWGRSHLNVIADRYKKAPYYTETIELLEPFFLSGEEYLYKINASLIKSIANFLKLEVKFSYSSVYHLSSTADDRIIDLVHRKKGTTYISGRGGMNYQSPDKFSSEGIKLAVQQYGNPCYEAKAFPFIPSLSILDALFVVGRDGTLELIEEGKSLINPDNLTS